MRVPKEAGKRAARACQVGAAGEQRLDAVGAPTSAPHLCTLPAVEALRQLWGQPYYRGTGSGLAAVRWRPPEEQPPAAVRLPSPYELEARSCTKRDTHWVGSPRHRTEPCELAPPDLIPPGRTTPATTPEWTRGPPRVQD